MAASTNVAIIPPSHAEISAAYHHSQAVWVESLQMLFVSGQVGLDAEWNAIPDPTDQYVASFESLKTVLAHAGADFCDVVDLVSYHVSFDDFELFSAVKDRYFLGPVLPAWTAVGVMKLGLPGLLVEVKCMAVVHPDKQ